MKKQSHEASIADDTGEGIPVCITCFEPVDPLVHYCANCGEATANWTPYLPFINIRWQVSFWGRAWEQAWSRDISVPGRLLRMIMLRWLVVAFMVY